MKAQPADPNASCLPVLPGADFADAFVLEVAAPMDAPTATARAFERMPGWVRHLIALRNWIISPIGLKKGASDGPRFGIFPVLQSSPERVVLGLDDWHLDFRIVVDVAEGRRVTLTTLVRRNNRFGRAYLALVMPFHKRIAPACLARVALG